MTEQKLEVPTRAEFEAWYRQTKSGQFFQAYLASWVNSVVASFMEGKALEGSTYEEIAVETVKERAKAIVFHNLFNLTYDEIITDLQVEEAERGSYEDE